MKLRALVIDDSKVTRCALMSLLPKTGLAEFEFAEAENGEEALAQFQSGEFDILFVDWQMPVMDGLSFIEQVRKLKSGRRIPIVMVSSNIVLGDDEQRLMRAGADEYILKPFDIPSLQTRLEKLFRKIAVHHRDPRGEGSGARGLLGRCFGLGR